MCAAAPTLGALIAWRAAQGLLGAPLVPLAMSVLLARGGGDRQISATAGLLFFLAPALGPTLGGGLITTGSWRWIFLVNVPIGLLGLLGTRRIPGTAVPTHQAGARFDPVGIVLLAGGLTLALYGTSQGSAHGWTGGLADVLPLTAGVVLLAGYVGWALRRDQPAVDLGLLRHGQASLALGLSVLSAIIAFATVFLLPVFTQSVQHYSALATGLALLPQGVVTGLGTVIGQRLLTRIGVRTLVLTGFVVLAASSACLLLITATTPLWVTALILSGRALAIGLGITPLLFAMLEPLNDAQLADGNTLFNIMQRLGGSIGVGMIGSLLAARLPIVGAVDAFHEIGLVLAVLAGVAAVLSLKLTSIRQPDAARPHPLAPSSTTPGRSGDSRATRPE